MFWVVIGLFGVVFGLVVWGVWVLFVFTMDLRFGVFWGV